MGSEPLPTRLLELARRAGLPRVLKAGIQALGFDLLRRHYYSPVPNLAELPANTWTRKSPLRGLQFDVPAGLAFVESQLAAHISEYAPPLAPTGEPRDFYMDNSLYGSVDAATLYAMVRRFSPRRILELGSGLSSLVIADARSRNGRHTGGSHVVYDPYPRPDLAAVLKRVSALRAVSATEVPFSEFEALRSGDMLFVDTTHTVKIGGEVNRVILDVLPILAPGVLVHFHDVYLPWEYPREFLTERSFFWTEQYLLQAFLAFNREFEVLFSAHALQRDFPEALAKLVSSARLGTPPSALWLRRVQCQNLV